VAFNVFNVGDTSQNYTKKMLVDELIKQVPDTRVEYTHREDDPRDYRVRFDKIRAALGFQISRTVPEGIQDVLTTIWSGVIKNPQDQNYYNTPI
jgi:nucleoside-diphosphate-sugar epimerase